MTYSAVENKFRIFYDQSDTWARVVDSNEKLHTPYKSKDYNTESAMNTGITTLGLTVIEDE